MGNLFKKSTIFILCLFALFLFVGMTYGDTKMPNEKGQIKESGKLPEWVIKGFWIVNGNFYASGSYYGHFVNERDAYFAALRELSQNIYTYLAILLKDYQIREESSLKSTTATVSGSFISTSFSIELAKIVKCNSIMKDYQMLHKDSSSELSSNNKETKELSEEYRSEYIESSDGVDTRYYMSAVSDNANIELAYKCSTKDLSETLKRIPIVDTYIHRKDGRVETFVLIKYPEKYLKELEKKESLQEKLKEEGK